MKSLIALFLLSVYTFLEFAAYMPQIIKLIRTKSADDISLTSWLLWIISSSCYLTYILLETPETGIIFAALLNLFFALVISILTAYYQHKKHK